MALEDHFLSGFAHKGILDIDYHYPRAEAFVTIIATSLAEATKSAVVVE